MNKMVSWEMAWVSGVFEGEGTFGIAAGQVTVIIGMTDEDIIRRLQSTTGIGVVYPGTKKIGQTKQPWIWKVGARSDVEDVIYMMLPYLGQRRSARAADALARIQELNDRANELTAFREKFFPCGHEVTPENTYLNPQKSRKGTPYITRRCRACAIARATVNNRKRRKARV